MKIELTPEEKRNPYFVEITLQRGTIRAMWEFIGEGLSGDYNPDDPKDIPLLRFSVDEQVPSHEDEVGEELYWKQLDDCSYCTKMPVNSPEWMLVKALGIILEAARQPSPKKRMEELSWFCPEDFDKSSPDEICTSPVPEGTVRFYILHPSDERDMNKILDNHPEVVVYYRHDALKRVSVKSKLSWEEMIKLFGDNTIVSIDEREEREVKNG